jgi:TolB-like protein
VALALAAPLCTAAPRPKVVVLSVGYSEDSLQKLSGSIAEVILTELGRTRKVEAMGTSDVSTILGLERQRQMLGCAEESASCLAEISAALGAPWLVTGSLARLGKALRIDLKLVRARDGKAVFRDGRSIKDETETFDVVAEMVRAMVGEMELGPDGAAVEAKPQAPSPPGSTARVVLLGAGALAAVGGGVLLGLGASQRGDVLTHPEKYTYAQGDTALRSANSSMLLGGVIGGVGLAAAASAAVWMALARPPEGAPTVSLLAWPGGGALALSMRL